MIAAQDLMVGDWVMLTDPINYGEKVQVKEIHGDGYITVDGGITKMYEPIAITAEILEKNFTYDPYGTYFFGGDYIEVYIKEYTDGLWRVEVDEIEMSSLPTWRMFVSNVHELQHALRLAGIDKEIKLGIISKSLSREQYRALWMHLLPVNNDNRHRCPNFRSWVGTSKGEITSACVDEDKRTIEQCGLTSKHGCPKKGGKQ